MCFKLCRIKTFDQVLMEINIENLKRKIKRDVQSCKEIRQAIARMIDSNWIHIDSSESRAAFVQETDTCINKCVLKKISIFNIFEYIRIDYIWSEEKNTGVIKSKADMGPKEIEICKMLYEKDFIKRGDIDKAIGTSRVTTYRYLDRLVNNGIIIRVGDGRASHYKLTKEGKIIISNDLKDNHDSSGEKD